LGTLCAPDGVHVTDRIRARRAHHHRDFAPADLLAAREESSTTVSVVIPARNEQGRVGRVVEVLRRSVVEELPLVDELVVVDGDSDDATFREAAEAGATVLRQSEILPGSGAGNGKGEALWKGLAATTGDLVVFVDADILNIGARFVTGLLGPLLTDPSVKFVKAAYDRPLQVAGRTQDTGGGRVTELMARPLLATFWPELGWLAQPLSGEYAGRRTLLEELPFVRGYGVELAMLIDIADQYGSDVIAEVDLDRREHANQDLHALGRMSVEILQVALERLAAQGRAVLTDTLGVEIAQPERVDGELRHRVHRIAPSQRPPLRSYLGD
jgi:glucosyl-3-phosphoglycerate synthase